MTLRTTRTNRENSTQQRAGNPTVKVGVSDRQTNRIALTGSAHVRTPSHVQMLLGSTNIRTYLNLEVPAADEFSKMATMRKEQHLCKSCGIAGHSFKTSLRCFNAKQYEGNVELWIQTTQHNGEGDVFETPTEEVSLKCTICGHLGHRNNNNLRCRRHAMFARLGVGRDGEEKGIQLWQDLTACLDAQKSGATEDVSDDRLLGIFL